MSPQPSPPAVVAVDIDGTLLSPEGVVLPGTRAELARAHARGATIVLASGRPVAGLRRLLDRVRLDLDGIVLAGSNGSVVVGPDSRLIARHSLPVELLTRLTAFVAEYDVLVMLCDGDDLVTDRPDHPQVAIECEGNDLRLRTVADLRDPGDVQVDKMLMYGEPAVLRPMAAAFADEFGGLVEHAFSAPFYFEATALGVDKGSALVDVARARGVDPADSVAFGDNGNDLPMLARAGIGVAMGNAIREVIEAADRVTATNAEDGIALVLADLFGDGEPAARVDHPDVAPIYPDGFDVVLNDEQDPDRHDERHENPGYVEGFGASQSTGGDATGGTTA